MSIIFIKEKKNFNDSRNLFKLMINKIYKRKLLKYYLLYLIKIIIY